MSTPNLALDTKPNRPYNVLTMTKTTRTSITRFVCGAVAARISAPGTLGHVTAVSPKTKRVRVAWVGGGEEWVNHSELARVKDSALTAMPVAEERDRSAVMIESYRDGERNHGFADGPDGEYPAGQ